MRCKFYLIMWLLYMAIVGISTLVAIIRYAIGDDGSLHHFISMTSNHLVLVSCLSLCRSVTVFISKVSTSCEMISLRFEGCIGSFT